jgi:3-hydroxyacyl-CoA dehydrogenase/enoyl-CoA hydratase/carnithine racemase
MKDYPAEDAPIRVDVATRTTPAGLRVALLTLTNGSERRPATFGPVGLANLEEALDNVRQSADYAAVLITGTGRTFCAGANLDTLSNPPSLDAAVGLARQGHRVFAQLSTLGIPTIAGINGTALGGGLELALHCTHRIALESAAPIGLPEIGLGLIPGWGGATVLPQLIGWESAIRVIVDNAIVGTTLDARAALSLGIVDHVVGDVTADGLEFIDAIAEFSRQPAPAPSAPPRELVDTAVARYASRPGNPIAALDELARVFAVVGNGSNDTSFAAEDAALSRLMMTAEFRRRLYAFRITSAANKVPAGTPDVAPRPIGRVGVVGAGLMASQIALAFAETLNVPVVISDVSQERLDGALARIDQWLSARVSKGSLTVSDRDLIVARVHPTLSLDDFADCDLVIEAVFEDLSVKHEVLTQLEQVVREDAILASNTSSLSIDSMASFVARADRVAGIHFFNPVSAMKLVEVARGTSESDTTLATAVDVARRLRKTPVIVADAPGFVVNRLLSTFLGEALRAVENGVSVDVVTKSLAPLRLPMSPFALIDLIGRTVTLKMMQSLYDSAPERFFVGDALTELSAVNDSSAIAERLVELGFSSRQTDVTTVHDTIVDALAREVKVMMDESVVAHVSDVDLCMINGAGWPSAIGGLTPYLDACGASSRATGALFHPTTPFD